MCGIVGFCGNRAAAPFLFEGLSKLEYRGYDSSGIAVLNNGALSVAKTVGRIESLVKQTSDGAMLPGNTGIGHTRWATHGEPLAVNAHPHCSNDGRFAVVHNGIIENYDKLRSELENDGFFFKSDTDTEVIPQLLQKYYDGDLTVAVKRAAERLQGSFALGIVFSEMPDTVVAVRRFSPLVIGLMDGENYIASDVTALISKTRKVIYPEYDDIAVITPDGVSVFDKDLKPVRRKISTIDWNIEAAEKGEFEHFMLKEITEQPYAVERTLNSYISGKEVVFDGLSLNYEKLKSFKRIVITACGSAYHAGFAGKYVFEKLLRIPTEVDLASEFRYRDPLVDASVLTVVISQSGETADTLAALNEAKDRGSHTLAIVNVVGSSIAKAADDVIYTLAGPEIAVATTKGYTTQLAAVYLFALFFAKKLGTLTQERFNKLLNELCGMPEKMRKVILNKENIRKIAENCHESHSLFFIGRNIDYATALEASLKLKEISYLHSEAYAAGELKHGTISLIENGKTVIALACCEGLYDKLLNNIREVRARGAYVIACANEGHTSLENEAQQVIFVPKSDPLFSALTEIIPFQVYAYYFALSRGCDIDKPRNLAKSVTVE